MRRACVPSLVVLSWLIASGASAQAGSATAYVQRLNGQVDALMARDATTDAQRSARDSRVGAIIEQLLDYDAFAQGTLGAEWEPRTPEERQEFQSLLAQNIRQSYLRSLERIRDYEVTYLGETPTAGGVVVHATAQSRASRREPPILVDYAMHRVGGQWRVYDITTDAASLVTGQGRRFRQTIARDGWETLIERMRDHVAHPAG